MNIKYGKSKKSVKAAVSNEQYVAYSNGEDNIAKGRTLDECIKNLLRKVDVEDIIDWAIYIDKYVDGEWVESFKETDVYDMASGISAACGKKSVKGGKDIKRKPRNVQVYFWHNNAYNAVVMTDGEYWITFDESFDGIDLYDEDVIDDLKSYVKTADFNSFDDMYNQFADDENMNAPVVGDNFGAEFDSSELTKVGTIYEGKTNSACGKQSVKASNSGTHHRRRIIASASSYDSNMQKIQYYANKVVSDISKAVDIFAKAREGWAPIEIPDVPGDDVFYEWYVTDYIDFFDDNHSKDEEIYELRGRNVEYAVRYGYFDSNDLGNYGDDEDALYDFLQSFNYMEDIYYVTTEFGHTIADLAADPYAVFDDVFGDDESDKLYYSEEVLAEFDLLTSSDRVYDFAKDAQGIVNLYNEVSDYFSYSNAEQLLSEFESGFEEE